MDARRGRAGPGSRPPLWITDTASVRHESREHITAAVRVGVTEPVGTSSGLAARQVRRGGDDRIAALGRRRRHRLGALAAACRRWTGHSGWHGVRGNEPDGATSCTTGSVPAEWPWASQLERGHQPCRLPHGSRSSASSRLPRRQFVGAGLRPTERSARSVSYLPGPVATSGSPLRCRRSGTNSRQIATRVTPAPDSSVPPTGPPPAGGRSPGGRTRPGSRCRPDAGMILEARFPRRSTRRARDP